MKKGIWLDKLGVFSRQKFIYLLIIVFFLLYLLFGNWLFGLFVGLLILWAVALEFLLGAKEHGVRNELKETAIALLLAVGLWLGAGFVLQTPSPLNAIVSCSMLPHIQRGDMVILSGDRLEAPQEELASLAGIGSAEVYLGNEKVTTVPGSLYSYCAQNPSKELCRDFALSPQDYTEKQGELVFGYAKCQSIYPKTGRAETGPCVEWLEVNGNRYYENLENDVVVYQPQADEYYARVGDIIHRAFIRLKVGEQAYFLTKGDNNPVFDIQIYDSASGMGNRPVDLERSKGRILFSVPYVGYLKLFISPSAIPTPPGCDRHYSKWD